MSTVVLTGSLDEPIDLAEGISKRVMRFFKAQTEDWCDVCHRVTGWEERNLGDNLTAEKLAEHVQILDQLESVGRWLAHATQGSDFPDRATGEMVAMTIQDLKDRRSLWHGTMKPEEREKILRDIFNES